MIDRNHSLRKGISPVVMFSRMARLDAIQRGLRAVAFKLQAGEPLSQDVVEVGDALLNHLQPEPAQWTDSPGENTRPDTKHHSG